LERINFADFPRPAGTKRAKSGKEPPSNGGVEKSCDSFPTGRNEASPCTINRTTFSGLYRVFRKEIYNGIPNVSV
jgi:hypothetical protein